MTESYIGMGVVCSEQVLPGGPADGMLEPGDVLVEVNGKVVTSFLELEDVVDAALCDGGAGTVTLAVERGGERITVSPQVCSTTSITRPLPLSINGHPRNVLPTSSHRVLPFVLWSDAVVTL